jgi:hypothetical protein
LLSIVNIRVSRPASAAWNRFGYQIVNCAATIIGNVCTIHPVQMLFEFWRTASPKRPEAASMKKAATQHLTGDQISRGVAFDDRWGSRCDDAENGL